jgi:hypothetical protein
MRLARTFVGGKFNEGARLAWLALRERDWTVTDLRDRMLGPSGEPLAEGVVNRLLYGDTYPTIHSAVQIEDLLGVPPRAWVQTPARPFVLEAAKHAAKMSARNAPRKLRKSTGDLMDRSKRAAARVRA